MSEFTWTPEQSEAINLRGKNILVSAAAGSGKTTLLTERLKRLVLEDGVSTRELLVLTFTRAAANEMKQRFKQKLFNALSDREIGKLSENAVLNEINALTDAQISTIHSFAQTMIKRYFEILNIDPGFRIAEDGEINLLADETMDEVFESLFERHELNPDEETQNFTELADLFGGSLRNDQLKDLIIQINRFFETLPNPDAWVEKFVSETENVTDESVFELTSLEPLLDHTRSNLERIYNSYQKVDKHYRNIPWPKKSKYPYADFIEQEIACVEAAYKAPDFATMVKYIKAFPTETVRYPRGSKLTQDEKNIISYVDECRGNASNGACKEMRALQKTFSIVDLDEEVKNIQTIGSLFKNLVSLTKKVNTEIDRKKAQHRILYFSDLERDLLKLLENEDVRNSIKNEFKYIYLDEVQDTNGIQEEIIRRIESGNNRFMVGDVKQSIYRFRNADPSILIDQYHTYKEDDNNSLILLNRNFRSSEEIINGINAIFERIMSEEIGEIDYNDEAKLIVTREDHTLKPEIDLIEIKHDGYVDKDELQARFIAKKIHAIVSEGRAKYKDIGILYRSINPRVNKILKVFAQEGIPVLFEGDSEQVDTIEIAVFLKFLSLIDNHKQDLPLASVMALPVFGFTADDMARIRTEFPDEPYLFLSIEKYRELKDDELSERLKKFYEKLERWRRQSKHIEIDDFLWQLLLDSGLYNYFGNLPGGKERKANLRILIDKAKGYKESSLKGITSFLQYVEKLSKNGQSLTLTGSSADSTDVVRLMSIHKSKGLEFKVVIYADLNRKFNLTPRSKFYFSKDYGFGAKLPAIEKDAFIEKNTLLYDSLAKNYRRESLSEEMRLLYVAMTRAKDELYIVADVDSVEVKERTWREGLNSFDLLADNYPIDWIMKAIYADESFAKEDGQNFSTDCWTIKVYSSKEVMEENTELVPDEIIQDEAYLELKEQIFAQLDKPVTPVKNNKPYKMSVSRIKRHAIQEEEPVELIPLIKPESEFKGKDIGTATHTLMQRMDLDRVNEDTLGIPLIEDEIKRIVEAGFIDEKIASAIDKNVVLNFLNSELGKRYLKSYQEDPDNVLKENPFLLDTNKEGELEIGLDRPVELSGVIDVCFLENDKWVLVDYKTDHKYSEKQWKQRIDEYSTQINLYARALEQLTGLKVKEKHLAFISENEDIVVD